MRELTIHKAWNTYTFIHCTSRNSIFTFFSVLTYCNSHQGEYFRKGCPSVLQLHILALYILFSYRKYLKEQQQKKPLNWKIKYSIQLPSFLKHNIILVIKWKNNAEWEYLHVFALMKSMRSPERLKGGVYKCKPRASKSNKYGQTHKHDLPFICNE